MPTLAQLSAETVAVLALVALLITAYRHPSGRLEALIGMLAAGAALATGLVGLDEAGRTVRDLAPVVIFLATILVVSDVCARAGLFAAAGRLLRLGRPDRPRLFTLAFLLAAVVTAVLSLDATVVLLTPVVVGAAVAMGLSPRPGAYACLRMANSASILLPVSNLTNLLALPYLNLTFTGFALTMAPVLAVVLVVEYVALRVVLRSDLSVPAPPASTLTPARAWPSTTEATDHRPVAAFPLAVLGVMLAGFALTSPFGVDPCWVSGVAALALVGWARRIGLLRVGEAVAAAHLGFVVFVLALGVVVAAIAEGFLGDVVVAALPSSTTFGALLLIALIASVAANLLTNLSATLLVVPLIAPLGNTAVLAALLGLNIGAGLTYTGSLANLLWSRTLGRTGDRWPLAEFHRIAVLVTPISLMSAVAALWLAS